MSEPGDSFRLLTWNLWGRFEITPTRTRAIEHCLAGLRPDILTLQEIQPEAGGTSIARDIAARFGFQIVTTAPRPEEPDKVRRLSNAILSRWPIAVSDEAALPCAMGRDEARTILHAGVAHPNGILPVFTTHFNSDPGASACRCEQARFVARFVAERRAALRALVTGDLNAEPDSDEVRLLEGHKTAPPVPGLGMVDAWRYAEPDDCGWTWDPRNPHVADTFDIGARVDYVFTELAAGPRRVRAIRVAGNTPVEGTWPSDHAAVVVDLWP